MHVWIVNSNDCQLHLYYRVSGDLGLELTISDMVKNTYCIVGMFAQGEVWRFIHDIRQTKSIQICTYN